MRRAYRNPWLTLPSRLYTEWDRNASRGFCFFEWNRGFVSHTDMKRALAIALLAAAGVFAGYYYLIYLQRHRPPDFVHFYLGGKMIVSGRAAEIFNKPAYEPLIAQALREGAPPTKFGNYYFNRPLFQALFYAPFALLPYGAASDLFALFNFICLGLLIWKLPVWCEVPSRFRALFRIGLFCFYPFHWSIIVGQDTLLLTLLVACALRLAQKGAPGMAGFLLALSFFKPHLTWAYPFLFLLERRWKAAWSFLISGLVLILISFIPVGLAGVGKFIDLVQDPSSDIQPEIMGNVRAIGLHFGTAAGIVTAVLALACLAITFWKGNYYERVTAACLAPVLLSPHTYWQDYAMAAIPLALTPVPAVQLFLLVPWQFFYSPLDELPMICIALTWLVVVAALAVRRRFSLIL